MNLLDELFKNGEKEYALFSSKLAPTVDPSSFIGVRVPKLRIIAKEYFKSGDYQEFLNNLPHKYYEENLVHGFLIQQIKDYDTCISELDKFLPYVDNWAVSDTMGPKCFNKNRDKLIIKINELVKSKDTYTVRFGIDMLMSHFLDKDFKEEYLLIPTSIKSDEYYINMMIAWYYATALAKKWDETIKIVESDMLSKWIKNKTIQKAIESYRITNEQKTYLKTLKVK